MFGLLLNSNNFIKMNKASKKMEAKYLEEQYERYCNDRKTLSKMIEDLMNERSMNVRMNVRIFQEERNIIIKECDSISNLINKYSIEQFNALENNNFDKFKTIEV